MVGLGGTISGGSVGGGGRRGVSGGGSGKINKGIKYHISIIKGQSIVSL